MKLVQAYRNRIGTNKVVVISSAAVLLVVIAVLMLLKLHADKVAADYTESVQAQRASYLKDAKKLRLSGYIHRNDGNDAPFAPEERKICDDTQSLINKTKESSRLATSAGAFLSSSYQDAKKQSNGIPLSELESYGRYCNYYVIDTERRYDVDAIMATDGYKSALSDCSGERRCINKENYARFLPYQEKIVTTVKGHYEKLRDAECPFIGKEAELCEPYVTFEKEVLDLWQRYYEAMKVGDTQRIGQISSEYRAEGPLIKLNEAVKRTAPDAKDVNDFYGKRLKEVEARMTTLS